MFLVAFCTFTIWAALYFKLFSAVSLSDRMSYSEPKSERNISVLLCICGENILALLVVR